MKILGSLGVMLMLMAAVACGTPEKPADVAQMAVIDGKALYTTHCNLCHGSDGKKGLAGAKMIPESQMDLKARTAIIANGKGNMVPYRDVLSKAEINAVAEYTLTLK